jgi:hypothetical protein
MWGRNRAAVEDVVRETWPDDVEPSDDAIKSALQKANRALEEAGYDWRLSLERGYISRE